MFRPAWLDGTVEDAAKAAAVRSVAARVVGGLVSGTDLPDWAAAHVKEAFDWNNPWHSIKGMASELGQSAQKGFTGLAGTEAGNRAITGGLVGAGAGALLGGGGALASGRRKRVLPGALIGGLLGGGLGATTGALTATAGGGGQTEAADQKAEALHNYNKATGAESIGAGDVVNRLEDTSLMPSEGKTVLHPDAARTYVGGAVQGGAVGGAAVGGGLYGLRRYGGPLNYAEVTPKVVLPTDQYVPKGMRPEHGPGTPEWSSAVEAGEKARVAAAEANAQSTARAATQDAKNLALKDRRTAARALGLKGLLGGGIGGALYGGIRAPVMNTIDAMRSPEAVEAARKQLEASR